MSFGSAQHIADTAVELIHAARPGMVLLDCAGVPDVEHTALGERLGRERMFFTVHQAVEASLATRQAGNCGSVEHPRQST